MKSFRFKKQQKAAAAAEKAQSLLKTETTEDGEVAKRDDAAERTQDSKASVVERGKRPQSLAEALVVGRGTANPMISNSVALDSIASLNFDALTRQSLPSIRPSPAAAKRSWRCEERLRQRWRWQQRWWVRRAWWR